VAQLGVTDVEVVLERPKDDRHGDVATNVAMQLARSLRQPPRAIAERILETLDLPAGLVDRTEIAGAGFINFWLGAGALSAILRDILDGGESFGRATTSTPQRINVEFVSANPTGPLHVGHGRGAALGDAIASLLQAVGHEVTREFYVNDAGVQIDRLAESLWARVQQAVGRDADIPEGGYHGAYLVELAKRLLAERGPALADLKPSEGIAVCRTVAVSVQREEQTRDLEEFGVRFDVWSSEQALYEEGRIEDTLAALESRGVLYEQDGAVWLRTSAFGDTKDRVLRKSDGTYTYFLPDIAYHRTKAERGFTRAIDVWGADHHGYVARMQAAMVALGLPEDFFRAELVQLVRVLRDGQEVRFSKRTGDFVALRDLVEQTGVDAARYFFLMRKGDAQFVFDIDLATRQSEENPVYYVQYAHTRLAGIFRNAGRDPGTVTAAYRDFSPLVEKDELELIQRLGEYPGVIARAAEALEPHRVIAYLESLARLVNGWYHRHRVIGEHVPLMEARLGLARAAQLVLASGLHLLGISAPERM